MKDSGQNSPSTTLQLENEFLGFFNQQPGKLLGFQQEQRDALVETFFHLKRSNLRTL